MQRPLADEIRPKTLDEVVGQRHLLSPGAVLRRLIDSGTEANMVFYGPSGTGKTTIANIIARQTNKTLHRLNATTASLQDVKDIIADVGTLLAPGGILLYLDEIQYFNKKQQQSLLEFMENGSLTLIASTTENPYFYVYGALLSRSTVFEFKAVSPEEVEPAVLRALKIEQDRSPLPLDWEQDVPRQIATACGGDVRKAINAVELLCRAAMPREGKLMLTLDDVEQVAQRSAMRYDRGGDAMYDAASALMKSLRGSDPDAALHYLARFLEAGDLITPCRRLLCSASEDVGMAYPQAVSIVKACVDTAMQLGLPEAQLPLAQAAILLVAYLALVFFCVPQTRRAKIRLPFALVLWTAVLGYSYAFFFTGMLPALGIYTQQWVTQRNGFLLNFTIALRYSSVDEPEGYSEETVLQLMKEYPGTDGTSQGERPVNIIGIMNESFGDFSIFDGFAPSEDPLPFLHSMEENTIQGWMYSPVTGGGTATVEFEFLTGFTSLFQPHRGLPAVCGGGHALLGCPGWEPGL